MKRGSRLVLVTGGSKGIGAEIVDRFRSNGDRVVVWSRSRPLRAPAGVEFEEVDVRDRAHQLWLAQQLKKRFGGLDAFVCNAGVSRWKPLSEIDEPFLRDVIDTNVIGAFWGAAAAASVLKRGGSIVNVSSLAGKRGSANNSAYCASKFALNGLTQSLAKELGPRGIRVNAVCPVYVETEMILESLKDRVSPAGGRPVKTYLNEFSKNQTALGRLPTAREVADVVFFLASEAASAVSGQCLNVDCGTLPQ